MPIYDSIVLICGWNNLHSEYASFPDLTRQISEFNRDACLPSLAKLLFLLSGRHTVDDADVLGENELLSKQNQLLLTQYRKTKPHTVVVFTRTTLLNIVKLLCLHGKSDGGLTLEEPSNRHILGNMCLKCNDLIEISNKISHDHLQTNSDLLQGLITVGPYVINENFFEERHYITRYYNFFFKFLPSHLETNKKSLSILKASFYKRYNCDFIDTILIALCIYIMFWDYDLTTSRKVHPAFKKKTFFANFTWTKDRIDQTMNYLSIASDEMSVAILSYLNSTFFHDFEALRSKPLCLLDESILITDKTFLLESIGNRLIENIGKSSGKQINKYVGNAMEDYVWWLISSSFSRKIYDIERLTPPKIKKYKIADFAIRDQYSVAIIEFAIAGINKNTLRHDTVTQLDQELSTIAKETKQIASSIVAELNKSQKIPLLVPILVVSDRLLSFWMIQNYFDEVFQSELKYLLKSSADADVKQPRISRLITMSLDTFETVCDIVHEEYSFTDILHAILAEDPDGKLTVPAVLHQRKLFDKQRFKLFEQSMEDIKAIVKRDALKE